MDLNSWLLPSAIATSIISLLLWLGRNLISTFLTKGVEHRFNAKLEKLRADLQSKEAEIAALRGGALTAMASRQMTLDKRKLEAVDQLWSAITALQPARSISSLMASVKFEVVAEEATKNVAIRNAFSSMSTSFDTQELNLKDADRARPFVSPMAWALYSAYHAIAMQAVIKIEIIKSGIDAKNLFDKVPIAKLVKTALPHQASYVDQFGEAGYHNLLEELEAKLLKELNDTLAGAETDKATIQRAEAILKQTNEISASRMKQQATS